MGHVSSWPKLGIETKFHDPTLGHLVASENANKVYPISSAVDFFNTGPYGDPPLKIKISKIGLRSDLSWLKVGLEPKFHEPGTFGGFGKREQTDKHTRFMFYKYRYNV